METLRDWAFDANRPLEMRDFVGPAVIAGDMRAIVQDRLIAGVESAAALSADLMGVKSPFNYRHVLTYTNYAKLRPALMVACADGLAPVPDALAVTGKRLAHVHLQDVDGHADRHLHPGDGRIAWHPVMQALSDHRGNPRLLLEVCDRIDRLPATAAWLKQMLGHAWACMGITAPDCVT